MSDLRIFATSRRLLLGLALGIATLPLPAAPLPEVVGAALDGQPEVLAAEARVRANRAIETQARSAFLPDLSLSWSDTDRRDEQLGAALDRSAQRTEAALLAVDMLERIRGNRARLADYASSGVGAASGSALPVPASDCRHLPCTPGQLRAQDLWEWEQALDGAAATRGGSGLVNALGCLRVSGRLVTVEIVWEGFRAQQPPPTGSCGSGRYGAAAERRQSLQMTSFIAAGEAG